jgi:lipopolysaccharide transport system permease protein
MDSIVRLERLRSDLRLGWILGWQEVANSYKRSRIGPFWTTINTSVLILCLGWVFGSLTQDFSSRYFAYIAFGVVFWGFFSSTLSSAGTIFTLNEQAICHTNLNFRVYYLRHMAKSVIILAHNIVIFPIVLVVLNLPLQTSVALLIPGFLMMSVFLWSTSCVLAYLSTRFRDFGPMILSAITILFYITPVVWTPDQIVGNFRQLLVDFNPLAHLLELLRSPLLGDAASLHSWVIASAATIAVTIAALLLGRSYRKRVAYWL